jgi:peptidoglycan/LPS O-acetylase OafA/YrhL
MLAVHYSNIYKKAFIWIISTAVLLYQYQYISCFNFGLLTAFIYTNKKELILKLRRSKIIKIMTIIIIALCYGLKLFNEQITFILSVITAFFVVSSLTFVDVFQWFFSNKISRFLGKISFPLYITHLPVICVFTSRMMIKYYPFKENIGAVILIYSATALLSLLIACCFFPVEKLSIWFSQKTYLFICKENK